MSQFDLTAYAAERREWINSALDLCLPSEDEPPATLSKSIRYSIFCGGKRLRPMLALAGADVVGGDRNLAMPVACAVECIHTFSLIHDDLPAIDNDDLRRGRPTNHKVFGDAIAILAGDALLALSFELIASCAKSLPAGPVLEASRLISKASGTTGMVGGQIDDIGNEGCANVGIAEVESVHRRKTGALLTASLVAGAVLFDPPAESISNLTTYGEYLGLAFQIADDLLDIQGDPSLIGKPVGSDLKHDKATYPKLLGIAESQRRAREAVSTAVAALTSFGSEADPLRALARYTVERRS
jgi:geranylgeranyl diphosphate synthase type II